MMKNALPTKQFKLLALTSLAAISDCGPDGMDESSLYITLQEQGHSMVEFQTLVGVLKEAGWIKKNRGHVLVATKEGMVLGHKIGHELNEIARKAEMN